MARIALLLVLLCAAAPAAWAHAGGLPISPAEAWHHWNFDPLILSLLFIAHWLYGRGIAQAWRKAGVGRVVPLWRVACFALGEITLVIALVSPLDPLGETLLSAHMAQHILLTAIAPPLLVLGMPVQAWTWALPRAWRRVGASPFVRGTVSLLDSLSRPIIATLVAVGVMWAWHVPAMFEAALEDETLHTLEHITFFLSALLGWKVTLSERTSSMAGAAITLAIFMAGGMLGGLLSLAPVPLYDWYGNSSLLWGLSPVEDQQVAGILMWVAAGGIYLAAFVLLSLRVASPSGSRRGPRTGIIRASTSSRSMK